MARHTAKSHKIRKVEILVIQIAILRNEFINITEEISHDQIIDELSLKEVDEVKKEQFFKDVREKRKKQVITNLLTGAIRFRINRYRYSWKSR